MAPSPWITSSPSVIAAFWVDGGKIMSHQPFNSNLVPLIQGIRPYLKAEYISVADGILSIMNLISSQQGQEAARAMSRMLHFDEKNNRTLLIETAAGPMTLNLPSAFTLFLILILLILSGNLLAGV